MSPDHRIRFETAPFALRLPGQDAVEFAPRPAPLEPAEIERRRLEAELAAARAEIAASKQADAELRARLEASIQELGKLASGLKRELDAELDAARPAFASLALSIAERALVTRLPDDPLLLLPAAERAVERVKAGLDDALVVELRVPPATAQAFEVAVLGRQDGALRIVADPAFQDGMVEARIDVRRVRHSIQSVLSDVRRTLDPGETTKAIAPARADVKPAAANLAPEASKTPAEPSAPTVAEPAVAPAAKAVAPAPKPVAPAKSTSPAPAAKPVAPAAARPTPPAAKAQGNPVTPPRATAPAARPQAEAASGPNAARTPPGAKNV